MTKTILTEEEKIARYDLERGRVADVAPTYSPLVTIECLYKPADDGDLTDDAAAGKLAYTDYVCGQENARACVTHNIRKNTARVDTGCLDITFDEAEQYIRNLQALLADPRVHALRRGEVLTVAAPVQTSDDEDEDDEADDNPLTEEEEAAYDAAHQQKVYDRLKSAFESKSDVPMFIDTLPGRVNDVPIDLLVTMNIGAAMERNLTKLGITRDQLFRILDVAVNPVVDEYLITPQRRMRLIWDGFE